MDERVLAAARFYDAVKAAYNVDSITMDQLTDAIEAMKDAKLAVAKTRPERIEILQQNVELYRDLEKRSYLLYQIGTKGGEAALHARAKTALLTAEVLLLRERLKVDS